MGKRFTDTDIWDQDWYVELPTKYKLFWNYIKDKCDNAGIWRPNIVIAQRIIGETINKNEFIQFVNSDKKRIIILPTGRWFLKDYFIFQYGDVFSPTSPVHRGAIRALVSNGIHPSEVIGKSADFLQQFDIHEIKQIAYSKDSKRIVEAYDNGINSIKDKDKDKE